MVVMFSAIFEVIITHINVEKIIKQTYEALKMMNESTTHLHKFKIQSLKKDFEILYMGEDELVIDYVDKFSRIVTQKRNLGEKIFECDVVSKLLHLVSSKFDSITSSIEQFQDLDSLTLEEIVGSLKVHEDKLKNR